MKGTDGTPLRIIETVAAGDYKTFGMCLLQDENGDEVQLIRKYHEEAEAITQAIIKKWLTSDVDTHTYRHLLECLKNANLGTLAELIAESISVH